MPDAPRKPPATLRLSKIRQISVTAHDLDRAAGFYRDVLGMTFLFEAPGMAFFDCDGLRLMLAVPSDEAFDHPSSILYFDVEDLAQAYTTLHERGVTFEQAPHVVARHGGRVLRMAFFRDTEGNLLALSSETVD